MLIYVNITDRQTDGQTDKHIKNIVRNLTKETNNQAASKQRKNNSKRKLRTRKNGIFCSFSVVYVSFSRDIVVHRISNYGIIRESKFLQIKIRK
jgi:hypothetical protein